MVNFSTLILSSEESGPGGLFDIGATLPLVGIQFLLLMVVLNVILYSPLLTVIEERKELAEASNLTNQYEQELSSVRKEAQLEIINSQKIHQEILEIEVNISQKYIDNLLDTITKDLTDKKVIAFNSLDRIVASLCDEIENTLKI
jgi:F-type H+-transporting ATPase subunit b